MQCTGAAYFIIFVLIALIKAPSSKVYRPYRTAKCLLAGTFASMALNLTLWCVFNNGDWNSFNYTIAAVDIILFFLEYMLLCNSYCILLNKDYATPRRIATDLSLWAIAALTAAAALLPALKQQRNVLVIIALLMLIGYIGWFVYSFRRQYRRYREMLDNYFSNDMQRFARWTSRSVTMIVVSWCFAILTMFGDIYLNWLYQFYVISLHVYIAVSFINYAERYGDLAKAEPNDAPGGEAMPADGQETDAVEKNSMEHKIDKWLEEKKYLSEQLTIDDLAAAIGTNKNYLSYHINAKYGMSFSSWIAGMRIDEAKRQMREFPDRKLETIAYSSGFSSASYFSKVFSLHEGMSPTRWRKNLAQQ